MKWKAVLLTTVCSLNIIKPLEAPSSLPGIQRADETWRKQSGNPKYGTYKRSGPDSAKVNIMKKRKI